MPIAYQTDNVFDAALDRLVPLYEAGHRIVVSFSAGKDSGVALELCLIAARLTNRLPVEVVMRDEEIMFPGTYEYAERVAARDEVKFYWIVAGQPIINIFNRKNPYFWAFDTHIEQEKWVRTPPSYAIHIPELNIQGMVHPERFPPAEGKELYTVLGLRTQESLNRKLGLHSSKGWLTGKNSWGCRYARPIYDWRDDDIWKSIQDNKWDYNSAYDIMHRLGVPKNRLRIAPPTLAAASIDSLQLASQAWPKWFDKVCERLPGVRSAANYGRRVVEPIRKTGETWKECYQRTCIDEAPPWIAERSKHVLRDMLTGHRRHSTEQFPEKSACPKCGMLASYERLAKVMYMGDPFSMKTKLPYVEPEFFRAGSGTWKGKPTW